MNTLFKRYVLATTLCASASCGMAQEMSSAYFTDDFMYRHDMNPAYGNEQGYFAIPVLGNFNVHLQGSLGVGDVFFKNPDYGKVAGAKKTTTFLHPAISADEALKGFKKGSNTFLTDIDLDIISIGFKGMNGYNTIELKERTHVGLALPYDLFDFAKSMSNRDYSFDEMGARAWSYAELAFGHSHKIFENLRVGAKVKVLLGGSYANVTMDGMHAKLEGDHWIMEGQAKGELNMKGAKFKEKEKEYESMPGKYYKAFDGVDVDNPGISGFGLGLDLGGIFEFKDCSVEWLNGLKVSLAVNDLGFINWSNSLVAQSSGKPFRFDGFNNFSVKEESGQTIEDQFNALKDDMTDFTNLENKGDQGSSSHALAATLKAGLQYPLPVYDKVSFGLLYNHRFDGKYSWSEGRLSANYTPTKWLDGGINVAFTSFCTTMGWILNLHPKGFNFFVGMDHIVGKTGKSYIPLGSNVSFNMGMNITWGGKRENKKDLKTLKF